MKVYLAWSGDTSQKLAAVFERWLPLVLQHIQTFYSQSDIDKGTRWSSEISRELDACNAGILFITPDNQESRWIMFEAGALSKAVDNSRVCPLLFGFDHPNLQYPLAQFQASLFDKEHVKKLVYDLNTFSGEKAVSEAVLNEVFDAFWKKLEGEVKEILETDVPKGVQPTVNAEDVSNELLQISRLNAERLSKIEQKIGLHERATVKTPRSSFRPGAKVEHSTFGIGIVVSSTNLGEGEEFAVAFPKPIGIKRILYSPEYLKPVDTIQEVSEDEEDPFTIG